MIFIWSAACSSSEPLNVFRAVWQATILVHRSFDWFSLAKIVLKSIVKCLPFLFLPSLQDLFSSPVVHIRRRHVPDSFAIAPVGVNPKLNSCSSALKSLPFPLMSNKLMTKCWKRFRHRVQGTSSGSGAPKSAWCLRLRTS